MWSIDYFFKRLFSKKIGYQLKRNKCFNASHKGETCFILGNGPSLRLEKSLWRIANYPVFTVNQFYRSELFNAVQTNFHLMTDPLFFELDKNNSDDLDTISRMDCLIGRKDIVKFFPIEAKNYLETNFSINETCYFIKNRYVLTEKYSKAFRLDGYLPTSRNVVQTAIYVAISMGFKNIVLLGCDMTGLLDNYVKKSPDYQEKFSHAYDYTEQEKRRMKRVHIMSSNEYVLQGFYSMFKDFRLILDYSKKHGLNIYNASKITAIDSIPVTSLEDFLKELENK